MTKTMQAGAVATAAALFMSLFAATPALALGGNWWGGNSGNETDNDVKITVTNNAMVVSTTEAKADTGDNYAGGSYGGDAGKGEGGNGGDAEDKGDAGNGGYGEGGNGGNASAGGLVETGNATATAGSMNVVNTTDIEVEQADCGCNSGYSRHGWGKKNRGGNKVDNEVEVTVGNNATVVSTTEAKADTGDNAAKGSYGGDGAKGEGGNGGDVEGDKHHGSRGSYFNGWNYGHGSSKGGDAGNGGAGIGGDGGSSNIGGTVGTGEAESTSGSVNVVNTTLLRVRR